MPWDAVIDKASQLSYMFYSGLICSKPGNPAHLFKQVVLSWPALTYFSQCLICCTHVLAFHRLYSKHRLGCLLLPCRKIAQSKVSSDEGTPTPLCSMEKKVQHIASTHQGRGINLLLKKAWIHFSWLASLTYGTETEEQVEHKHVTPAKEKSIEENTNAIKG